MTTLGTSLDVQVSVDPVVAGIERGRLENGWTFCPFEVKPHYPSGCVWKASFNAKDEPDISRDFNGTANSRRQAKQLLMHALTSHMAAVAKQRATRTGLRIVAAGGITAPAPGVLGWLLRLLVRFRSWVRRALQ